MSRKLDSFSEKQARGGKRLPFADITNSLNSKPRQHAEPSSPPLQSRALNTAAMQLENDSRAPDSTETRNCLAETVAPLRNQRAAKPIPPPLTWHSGFPSQLENTRTSLPVKAISGFPSDSLPGSDPHPKGNLLRSKPSRRQVSLGSGILARCPNDPDLCDDPINNVLPCDVLDFKPPLPSMPVPSTREPLSTSLLPPKTHKLACGQLAILPSRSVLVDFREGERRAGRKGNEVIVVSPNGDQINLFSAPHLSTPCCLAEPIATYSLNELPTDRYKLYEQAKKVIEHIKRNIPKVIMYESDFVCTLMANEPRADIEIRTNPRSTTATISASATTSTIRIRFSRKLRTMQIFTSEPTLCKKTMFCTARGVPTDAGDWALLSKNEKECLAALLDFLRVAEAVEGLPHDASVSEPLRAAASTQRPLKSSPKREEAAHAAPSAALPSRKGDAHPPGTGFPNSGVTPSTTKIPLPSTASATAPPPSGGLTPITVSPRPRFPSAAAALPRANTSDTLRKASSSRTAVSDVPVLAPPPVGDLPSTPLALVIRTEEEGDGEYPRDLTGLTGGGSGGNGGGSSPRLQTRFMPGVGWCVRSGGGRYRIMFADGVALEVDVDEERVEVVEPDGSVLRCTVRDCGVSRKVGDRMKVFRKFLSLFEEASDP